MKLSSLKVNADTNQNARWVKDLPDLGDIEVFVRSINNPQYRRHQQALVRALSPNAKRKGIVDPLEMDRINSICLAHDALCAPGWRNLQDESGVDVPFDAKTAEKMMLDPEFRKFREGVFVAASQVDEENEEENKDTEKNSEKPSVTA
jgi:hypothetical protein